MRVMIGFWLILLRFRFCESELAILGAKAHSANLNVSAVEAGQLGVLEHGVEAVARGVMRPIALAYINNVVLSKDKAGKLGTWRIIFELCTYDIELLPRRSDHVVDVGSLLVWPILCHLSQVEPIDDLI